MAKFEFIIAVKDEADLASGHKRKKAGDILTVRSYPWSWGRKEIDEYLVVLVEVNATLNELREKFEQHCIEGGYNERDIIDLDPLNNQDDKDVIDAKTYTEPVKINGQYMERPAVIGKNKYKMPLANLKSEHFPELDLTKVEDKKKIYQPFKKLADVEMSSVDSKDIDCGTKPTEEKVITWDSTDLITDNYDNSYITK